MSESPEPMELRVADVATGRLVARLPYRDHDENSVDRALAELGFEVEKVRSRYLPMPRSGSRSRLRQDR